MTLKHDYIETEADSEAGFHVYLHEPRERFTEFGILSTGRIEYLKMGANEEIELKLTVQHFTQFRGRGSSCSDDNMKSLSIVSCLHLCLTFQSNNLKFKCSEMCRWKSVEDTVSCSGPWMTKATTPLCTNYNDVRNLIIKYK